MEVSCRVGRCYLRAAQKEWLYGDVLMEAVVYFLACVSFLYIFFLVEEFQGMYDPRIITTGKKGELDT
jgi:hypothetical protein